MHNEDGFTLIEILVVIIVVGIMAAFAVPQFIVTKERALDSEAKATLALFRSAEKIYKMEHGSWYPPGGGRYGTGVIDNINRDLKLSLPTRLSSWYYVVYSTGDVTAQRSSSMYPVASNGRTWTLNAGVDCENPTCSPTGTGTCLSTGGCPS